MRRLAGLGRALRSTRRPSLFASPLVVTSRYCAGSTSDAFRAELRQSNDPRFRYVANFDRATLWGSGHGHISPILGYLEAEDLVFVGDVNDDYGPFLTSSERLLEAMNTRDDASGQLRGLLRVGSVG